MNEKTQSAVAGQVERPVRPDCFEFAMDFLGGPEDEQVSAYADALEAWADAAVAAERERCAAWLRWYDGKETRRSEAIRNGDHWAPELAFAPNGKLNGTQRP